MREHRFRELMHPQARGRWPRTRGPPQPSVRRSAGWGEELERDAVRVPEAHARPVRRVLDAAVLDAELVQATSPALELPPVRTAEADMVETDPELAEFLCGRRRSVLVQPD